MFKMRPSLIIIVSFLLVILTGALLLTLPAASAAGQPTSLIDAYFTANSATCVTGLTVVDTGLYFSTFGLLIILILIQIGGLGYMTFSTFILLVFRQKLFISQKLAAQEALNLYSSRDVINVLKRIFGIIIVMEGLGTLILFFHWLPQMGGKQALWYALFHSVSAFNNAGFALFPKYASFTAYVADPVINLTIAALIIIGGLGFIVINDLLQHRRLSLHSKVVLSTTSLLLVGGTLLFYFMEYHNPATLGTFPFSRKILAAFFLSVTSRTAGFNTIDIGRLHAPALLITMLLMFIGASPGGTGGGVKTSTFTLVISTIWATLKGYRDTILFRRRVPSETVRRAFAVVFLSLSLIATAIFALVHTESCGIMEAAFETFSAFGTVGLSMGITPTLSYWGKIIIIFVMFIGRIGPLTLMLTLFMSQKERRVELPKEGISIG